MLPPIPPIFYGREDVVNEIVQIITGKEPARVAVLGPGGVGKVGCVVNATKSTYK